MATGHSQDESVLHQELFVAPRAPHGAGGALLVPAPHPDQADRRGSQQEDRDHHEQPCQDHHFSAGRGRTQLLAEAALHALLLGEVAVFIARHPLQVKLSQEFFSALKYQRGKDARQAPGTALTVQYSS